MLLWNWKVDKNKALVHLEAGVVTTNLGKMKAEENKQGNRAAKRNTESFLEGVAVGRNDG